MKAEDYKRLISERDVFDKTTLNVTLKEVYSKHEFELVKEIQRILENNQILKPELHTKPYDETTNYYKVDITSDQVEKIIDIFFELEASYIGENGETTPTAAFYAGLADKWNQLV
jgi:uncharacterized protein YpuA (DUF1002 family)